MAAVYALSGERSRPVRVAIVGEFNAGKSTFINALIGADVAPTGVLPTTATLHHVRYAPDRFARIVFVPGHVPPERIVQTDELRATLRSLDVDAIVRVEILLPLESLTRVEIIDTPGFNAPDARHTRAARSAFDEAAFAVWLLDASQARKGTERAVLEEARAADLPVQVLVNKIDRLSDTERAKVMALVDDGLVGMGLVSWRPPIGFSARGALAALLGTDPDARDEGLRASGWSDVTAFVQDHVVARSAEVKERALRRRARALVARLLARTDGVARDRDEREATRAARAHAFTQNAIVLERDVDARALDVVRALERPFRELARDLTVLAGTRRADGAGSVTPDATKERYREGRCLAHLALPLAEILATFAPHAARVRGTDLLPMARQLVRGFASGTADLAPSDGSATLPVAFGRAAVLALADEMLSRSTRPIEPSALVGVRREIQAFAAALA
ncbi:MAG: dynamin family protein [Polyangiaceae bacterium]